MSGNSESAVATVLPMAMMQAMFYAQKALGVSLHDGWGISIEARDVRVTPAEERNLYNLSYDKGGYTVCASFTGSYGRGDIRITTLKGPGEPFEAFTIFRFIGSTPAGDPVLCG